VEVGYLEDGGGGDGDGEGDILGRLEGGGDGDGDDDYDSLQIAVQQVLAAEHLTQGSAISSLDARQAALMHGNPAVVPQSTRSQANRGSQSKRIGVRGGGTGNAASRIQALPGQSMGSTFGSTKSVGQAGPAASVDPLNWRLRWGEGPDALARMQALEAAVALAHHHDGITGTDMQVGEQVLHKCRGPSQLRKHAREHFS
jgi:hypothetical protein